MDEKQAEVVILGQIYRSGALDPFIISDTQMNLVYVKRWINNESVDDFFPVSFGVYSHKVKKTIDETNEFIVYTQDFSPHAQGFCVASHFAAKFVGFASLLTNSPSTIASYRRVAFLISGFESPSGLEGIVWFLRRLKIRQANVLVFDDTQRFKSWPIRAFLLLKHRIERLTGILVQFHKGDFNEQS